MRGQVKKFFGNKGYGFITKENGEDIFFHVSQVVGDDVENITEGQSVTFEIGEGKKGPQATAVICQKSPGASGRK